MNSAKISAYTGGRDNNFNLIRILAAFSVLASHSFALAIGSPQAEPLRNSLGLSLGSIAVDIFFVTSGFLVGASLFSHNNLTSFIISRILRIYPALITMILLTVLVFAPQLSSLPHEEYFKNTDTWVYLIKGITAITGINSTLPGVFDNNPYKHAVNGSLWTLPYELWMYCSLAVLWLVIKSTRLELDRAKIIILALTTICGIFILQQKLSDSATLKFWHLFFMFFSGTTYWLYKERIQLTWGLCAISSIALMGLSFFDTKFFYAAYILAIPYLILFLAYIPSGSVRKYNSLGDYSYGMYIFAFPIQQFLIMKNAGISPMEVTLHATYLTLLVSILSWNFIESQFLKNRDNLVRSITAIQSKFATPQN